MNYLSMRSKLLQGYTAKLNIKLNKILQVVNATATIMFVVVAFFVKFRVTQRIKFH